MEYIGKLYGKIGNKYFDTNHTTNDWNTLQKENEELRDELKLYTSILEGTEQGKTLKENTKLKEALKDIRSQLFDAKNCETILTKSIDGLLKD